MAYAPESSLSRAKPVLMRMITRNNFKWAVSLLISLGCISWSSGAIGFCIYNQTDSRLFFIVETLNDRQEPTISFRKWIDSAETACCTPQDTKCNPLGKDDSKMSFYVFLDSDSLEGCNVFGNSSSDIFLKKYISYDNCHWESS